MNQQNTRSKTTQLILVTLFLSTLAAFLFTLLKTIGTIPCSWWWILAPALTPTAVFILVFIANMIFDPEKKQQ